MAVNVPIGDVLFFCVAEGVGAHTHLGSFYAVPFFHMAQDVYAVADHSLVRVGFVVNRLAAFLGYAVFVRGVGKVLEPALFVVVVGADQGAGELAVGVDRLVGTFAVKGGIVRLRRDPNGKAVGTVGRSGVQPLVKGNTVAALIVLTENGHPGALTIRVRIGDGQVVGVGGAQVALGHLLAAFFVCGVHQVLVSVIFGYGGVQLSAFYLFFGVAVVGLHFFVEIHLTNIVQNVAYGVHIVKDLFNIFVGNKINLCRGLCAGREQQHGQQTKAEYGAPSFHNRIPPSVGKRCCVAFAAVVKL